MSKIQLRKKILKIRKKKYFDVKTYNNITEKIQRKINFSKKKIIGGYFPINFEFDCLQILEKFNAEGYITSLQ